MSDIGSIHSEVDTTKELTVGFVLTITSKVTAPHAPGTRRTTTKTHKETKSKEGLFTFIATLDNYLDFLRLCLTIHKQDEKYTVATERQAFKFKYYFSPGRPCVTFTIMIVLLFS